MIYTQGGTSKTSVVIGSLVYQLVRTEHVVEKGSAYYGQHDAEAIELHVDSTQPAQRQVAATLHEALHAMNAQARNELEEVQVEVLALQFMGFMRDNPKLFADMMAVLT
jgi:cell pole-organizing protein PopZ